MLLVITLYPTSQYGGWRSKNYTQCSSKQGGQFIECIENNTYYNHYNYGDDIDQSHFMNTKYIYAGKVLVMGQKLVVKPGSITNKFTSSLQIPLDDSLGYLIYFLDSKMNFLTFDTDLIPGIVIERRQNSGSNVVPIKVDII